MFCEITVKLKIGQCACSKNGRVYCRKSEGYRFTSRKCKTPGSKV